MCRLSREVRAVSSFVFSTVCVDLITLSVMVRFKVFFLFSNTTHSTEHDLESLASRRIHRWLLVEFIAAVNPTHPLDAKSIHNALKQSILANFGDSGWGAVGFSLTGQLPYVVFFLFF